MASNDFTNQQHERGYEGAGWYTVDYSDGSTYTDNGAKWVDSASDFCDLMDGAEAENTDTHLAYATYHGAYDLPDECTSLDVDSWVEVDRYDLTSSMQKWLCAFADAKDSGDTDALRRLHDEYANYQII